MSPWTLEEGTRGMAIRATGAEPLPPPIVYVYLAVIVVTWAGNWPLMKLALTEAAPLQLPRRLPRWKQNATPSNREA